MATSKSTPPPTRPEARKATSPRRTTNSASALQRRRLDVIAMSVEEISSIEDPVLRAQTAKTAYDAHTDIALEFSKLRRQTIADMHKKLKMPHKDIAEKLGISVVAASALAGKANGTKPASPRWWDRLPDDVASQAKRGPGGMSPDKVIANQEVIEAMLSAMKASAKGRPGVTHRPIDLMDPISRRLKRPVPHSALRAALRHAIEQGLITHVGWAEYAPTDAGNKPAIERRRSARDRRGSTAS